MSKSSVVLSGTLGNVGLFDALQLLAASSQSGVLRLNDPFPAVVHLVKGGIGCIRAEGSFSLADALDRGGLLGEVGDEDITAVAEADLLGRVTDRARLEEVVRNYVLDVLFELVVLSEGEFVFVAGVDDPWDGRLVQPLQSLMDEEQRRVAEWKEIARSIPPMTAAPSALSRLPRGVDQLTLAEDEWRVLVLIDGVTTVAGLVAASGMGPLDACRALYKLMNKGVVVGALD
ncbi:MAG TPA: DUF4388 domain-containing protein [Acidimicrobiales bacterium]|nr:DUF4388 domain-containing protein [Acidimicrobiales bacterium]